VPIEERLLEEKRHHTGTSHSRICIDIDQDSSSQAIDAYGILVCRLQVERTNYHGPELSTAIQRRNWRLTTRIPSRMEFSERTGHRSPQAALILFNLGFGDFLGLILSPLTARPPTGAAKERGPGREWRPGLCLRKHPSCAG
jgi:hypothetical protein